MHSWHGRDFPNALFSMGDLRYSLEDQLKQIKNEVENVAEEHALQTVEEAWADALAEKYHIEAPRLLTDQMWRSKPEAIEVDVSWDQMRAIHSPGPFYIPGHRIEIHIPFEGDATVFSLQPSSFSGGGPPAAEVRGTELIHVVEYPDDKPINPDPSAKELINKVETPYLQSARGNIESHNANLKNHALNYIQARRERIKKHRTQLAESQIPEGPPNQEQKTYVADAIVRLPAPLPQSAPAEKPIELHPALAHKIYEHILEVIRKTGRGMEKTTASYSGTEEEELRNVFLTALNTHYHGQGSAEGFNYNGKTDLLIQYDGNNLFVGECKWWGGEAKFSEAIDQLLGRYTTWRDGKLALLIFVRQKNLTALIKKAEAKLHQYEQLQQLEPAPAETELRAKVRWPGDDDRIADLHIFFFHFPNPEKTTARAKAD